MKKEEQVQYVIEREFLDKISVEDLISHIIRAHVKGVDSCENNEKRSCTMV